MIINKKNLNKFKRLGIIIQSKKTKDIRMTSNIFIPKVIHVGFKEKPDTFTKKLGYIIYEDEKGKLRKEVSWNNWRNKKLGELKLDNTPGRFVINKGVQRSSDWFGSGRSMVRIYDTRDFEFEISVDNLMVVLEHSDVSKRDIVQECVLGWSGANVVLIPTNSEEYLKSVEYTQKQDTKVSAKELVKGLVYSQKKGSQAKVVYMGNYHFFETNAGSRQDKGKKHVFYNLQSELFEVPSVSTLAPAESDVLYSEFAELDQKLYKSGQISPVLSYKIDLKSKQPAIGKYSSYFSMYKLENGIIKIVSLSVGYPTRNLKKESTTLGNLSQIGAYDISKDFNSFKRDWRLMNNRDMPGSVELDDGKELKELDVIISLCKDLGLKYALSSLDMAPDTDVLIDYSTSRGWGYHYNRNDKSYTNYKLTSEDIMNRLLASGWGFSVIGVCESGVEFNLTATED